MSRVIIEDREFKNPQFKLLVKLVGKIRKDSWNVRGMLSELWKETQEACKVSITGEEFDAYLGIKKTTGAKLRDGLSKTGYLKKVNDNEWRVCGNEEPVSYVKNWKNKNKNKKNYDKKTKEKTKNEDDETSFVKPNLGFSNGISKPKKNLEKGFENLITDENKKEKFLNGRSSTYENRVVEDPTHNTLDIIHNTLDMNKEVPALKEKNSLNKVIKTSLRSSEAEPASGSVFVSGQGLTKIKKDVVAIEKVLQAESKPKSKKHPVAGAHELIAEYVKAYKTRYESQPVITQKESGAAKNVVTAVGRDEGVRLVQAYVSMNDEWFLRRHHSLAEFQSNLSKVKTFADTGQSMNATRARDLERKSELSAMTNRVLKKFDAHEKKQKESMEDIFAEFYEKPIKNITPKQIESSNENDEALPW